MLSNSYLLAPLIQIPKIIFLLILLFINFSQYYTLRSTYNIKILDYILLTFIKPSSSKEQTTIFQIVGTIIVLIINSICLFSCISIFKKWLSPQSTSNLYGCLFIISLLGIQPILNVFLPFTIFYNNCAWAQTFCLDETQNIIFVAFLILMFLMFCISILIFSITVTQDDFSPKSVQLNSGGCWLFLLFLHLIQSLCAFHSQTSIYSLFYFIAKIIAAIFLFLVPVVNDQLLNSTWAGLEAAFAQKNTVVSIILFFVFFLSTFKRISFVIESALTWLIAQRRRAHNKAADQTFDIDFCYIPSFWIILTQQIENIIVFVAKLIWFILESILPQYLLSKIEINLYRLFQFKIDIPHKFKNVYGLEYINQTQNDIAGFLTVQNFIQQVQQRSQNGEKKNLKVWFTTPIDFCIVSKYIVDEYTNFYANSYFEGLHIQNIFKQQQIQVPYLKQLAYIAEAKFSNSQFIKLSYIITLRYYLNNIQEAQDQFNLQFEVDDDKEKEEKTKKFNQYQYIYQNIIERVLGQSTHLDEVMSEVKKQQQKTLKMIKLESRTNLQVVSANQTMTIQRLLDQWDDLDEQFAQFWLFKDNLSQLQMLNHVNKFEQQFNQFMQNIKIAKQISSGLFLYDVFACAANRYFHLQQVNRSLFHKYQLFRARFQDGQASLIIEGDQSYKIINHYQPNYFEMKRKFKCEPQIVITHQVNQVQERTFEQNINPVSIGQIQKGQTPQQNITYGPDEKCKLQSDLHHFQSGNKQIRIFNVKVFLLLIICFSLVGITTIIISFIGNVTIFQDLLLTSDTVSQQLENNVQNQIFVKIVEMLRAGQNIPFEFQRLINRLQHLSDSIQNTLHDNPNNLKPFILYKKDIRNDPTQQTSYFLLKAALLSQDIQKDFLNIDQQSYLDFSGYCFPLVTNIILIKEPPLIIFNFLLRVILCTSIIPLILVTFNYTINCIIRRDFIILTQLFQNLLLQTKTKISEHYNSFSKIRKRYYEIYGISNISQYLDVVISGNYFDSEILTEQTLQDLLKQHQLLQSQDGNQFSVNTMQNQEKQKVKLPFKKKYLNEVVFVHLFQAFILILIMLISVISFIVTIEFVNHERTKNYTNQQFLTLRDELLNTHQEILLIQLSRSYYMNSKDILKNPEQQEQLLKQFKKIQTENDIDQISIKITEYIQQLGSVTQQVARNIQDLLSFSLSLRQLIQTGMYYQTRDPDLLINFNITSFSNIIQVISKQENCQFPSLTNTENDLLKPQQQIDLIIQDIFFGCFSDKLQQYIFNIIKYIFKELEYQQQYHYTTKLQNLLITNQLVDNYYQHYLGFNQQDSLYIWPFVNVNHPSYTTSHRSDFYKKTKYVVQYISSYLPGIPNQELVQQLANGDPQPTLFSYPLSSHFQLVIILLSFSIYIIILLYGITFGFKINIFILLTMQIMLNISQVQSLNLNQSEYLMIQQTSELLKIQQTFNQDYLQVNNVVFKFYNTSQIEYQKELVDLISLTVKYHSIINIGRNLRFPKTEFELIPEQFQLEKHFYLALGDLLQLNTLDEQYPIDINSLQDSPLKSTLILADTIQLFVGAINKQIAFLIRQYQLEFPQQYLENFQPILQLHESIFIRQLIEFDQTKIDSFYLNVVPEKYTVIPSIGFFDGHVQWTGFNWFNDSNLVQQLCQVSFSSEISKIQYEIYEKMYSLKSEVSYFINVESSQIANTYQLIVPLYFYLIVAIIVIFTLYISTKINRFLYDFIIKRINIIPDDEFNISSLYHFAKISFVHFIFYPLLFIFIVTQVILVILSHKLAVQQNQMLYTQQVLSQTYNNIGKLQGLIGCELVNTSVCTFGAYQQENLLKQIQTSMSHLFTPVNVKASTLRFVNQNNIRNNPFQVNDQLNSFSAGTLFESEKFIKNIFGTIQISVPYLYVDQQLNVSQIGYLDYLSGQIFNGRRVNISIVSVFNSFFTTVSAFQNHSVQLKFQETIQMTYSIEQLIVSVKSQMVDIQKIFQQYSQISLYVALFFVILIILSWACLIPLYLYGKFPQYILKKLRTDDLYGLPAIYSDAADI